MNIKDFHSSLQYLFEAELTGFVWGHAGIGKSSIIKQYAKEKGYHFFPLYLGTQSDLGDILGLADFKRDEHGTAIATTFATPTWLRDTIDYCEKNPNSGAILFLDEFNRARRDILNGMFSLALDKTFHTIKLPKNCHIIAAGNPPTDEYYTTDVNETALMARFVHIKLEPSIEEWVSYAKDNNFEPSLVSFVQSQPQLLEDAKSQFTLPVKVDRRSYERMNKLWAINTPENIRTQLMYGILGLERAVAYEAFLNSNLVPLTGEEVLSGQKAKLLREWCNPKDIKSSLLTISCDNVLHLIEKREKIELDLTPMEQEYLFIFIFTLPQDLAFSLVSKLHKNKAKVLTSMINNIQHNQAIVALLKEAKGIK